MKKNQKIRISKLKAVINPKFKTPNWYNYIPGQDNGNVSLPVDYWAEGVLLEDVAINKSLVLHRTNRNGIKCEGILETSKITDIKGDYLHTLNSVYKIELI